MKEIKLTQNKIAFVDDEDYEFINSFKWFAILNKKTFYAVRSGRYNNGIRGQRIFMHREVTGIRDTKVFVDHIDHNGLNNVKVNLRIATNAQNCANRTSEIGSTSKYRGVYWNRVRNKWCAALKKEGKPVHLGFFDSEINAALAYNNAAKNIHGDFANLNIIK